MKFAQCPSCDREVSVKDADDKFRRHQGVDSFSNATCPGTGVLAEGISERDRP